MSPNAAGGPSGSGNGGTGAFHQQQPGGGFVPMFQPGGGPPGAAGSAPYGVQVMMLPQGGMYTASKSGSSRRLCSTTARRRTDCFAAYCLAVPGYQGQPGQQQQPQMGGPPFLAGGGGQGNGGRAGGAGGAGAGGGGPMGFYPMQQGPGGHPGQQQMQSPQSASSIAPRFGLRD